MDDYDKVALQNDKCKQEKKLFFHTPKELMSKQICFLVFHTFCFWMEKVFVILFSPFISLFLPLVILQIEMSKMVIILEIEKSTQTSPV